MPPSSFASALAGNNQHEPSNRESSSEWSRRVNGATHTFRRSSTATSLTSATAPPPPQSETPVSAVLPGSGHPPPPARYVPPHRNGVSNDMRYSRDQLLDLFKAQNSPGGALALPREDLAALYAGTWRPDLANGASSTSSTAWNRSEQTRDVQPAPDVCWDRDGTVGPMGLVEMGDDERELFTTSVNTPLKPPSAAKDGQQGNGLPGRKVSLSGASGNTGPLSPSVTRGSIRRRETSDSYPFPQNSHSTSAAAGSTREDHRAASPPPSLLRRRTDLKEKQSEREEGDEKASWTPFGSLRRNPTAGPLSAGIVPPSSPWSNNAPSAGLSPMGSFGNFGIGQQTTPSEKRPGLGSGRSESRFKDLLSRDGTDDAAQRSVERKTSASNLARLNENESWRPAQAKEDLPLDEADEPEESLLTGSAALEADEDVSPPHLRHGAGARGFGTPSRNESRDDFGFGAFGMTSDNTHGFNQSFARDAYQQSPSQNRSMTGGNEPMSPTDTNPYQSPEQHGVDRLMEDERDMSELQNPHLSGLAGFGADPSQQFAGLGGLGALPHLGRNLGGPAGAGDRSQTSSVGPSRGFPSLGGLGQLGGLTGAGGWPGNQNGGLGTPGRQTFGSGLFGSSMGEMQSPSLAGLGPGAPFGGSRMSSMFPPTMQEQSQQSEHERDVSGRSGQSPFPGLGEQSRGGDGQFDPQGEGEKMHALEQSGQQQPSAIGQGAHPGSAAASQPPPPQQRTMVMPDRMRWIYRDPQGQTQGPWSGLEMHDWYKAGFFSPELLVKKLEDPEYEPLAQLIRRIGNSREPFLVPQIGIPHGQPSTTGPNAWPGPGSVGSGSTSSGAGGAQPPFASSFPSFGTTLTAEQQNALERRKQEEQYLMARQKEHLAMAQRMHHPMPPGSIGGAHAGLAAGGQLHHQHSGQSLHSQPSFGSITSPTSAAYQPSPIQAPQSNSQGFFDNSFRAQGQSAGLGAVGAGVESLGHIREEEMPGLMNRLSVGNRAASGQFGAPGQSYASAGQEQHDSQVQQMLQDRARLQQEQESHDAQTRSPEDESNERLQQFQQLQGQAPSRGLDARFQQAMGKQPMPEPAQEQPKQELSLTEQVQKAASAQQSPAPQQPGFPQPFPPGPSQSPLPAPSAQRTGRQSVADQLQKEQRDSSQTPSIETPSAVAPWAKEPLDAPKGPSLKEIQETEAKKAAEREKIAAAARHAALQKEMEAQAAAQAQAATAITPGLAAASNWAAAGGGAAAGSLAAASAGPTTPGAAAWSKTAPKPTGLSTAQSMAQIQKEEEARKRRVAAVAAAQANVAANAPAQLAGGKSYANLAGKTAAAAGIPPPGMNPGAGGAWTTVGAGGKVKTPGGVPTPQAAAGAGAGTRAVSSGVVPTLSSASPASVAASAAGAVKKAAGMRSTTMGGAASTGGAAANAHDEFKKWAVGELRPDLNKGISAEDFVASLVHLPQDTDIITEAVHGVSSTIDSRHFAEEFVRRKRLADKGLVDASSVHTKSASPHNSGADKSGGWSEVAKKGGAATSSQRDASGLPVGAAVADDAANGNFRVVAPKKKGGKR